MNKKIINYLSLISFLIFPFFLFKVFSPNEMDSFWNYSSAINLVEYKSYFDLFFLPENKAIGLNLFKYIPTFFISLIYKLNGHQYTTIILSNYLWLISLFASLFFFLKFEFKLSFKEILYLSIIFILMEPLFRGIISLRAESISIIFTLFSLTLLKCRRFLLLAGFFSILSIESHITGIIGLVFCLMRLFILNFSFKSKLIFLIGSFLGVLLYLYLHPIFFSFVWVDDLINERSVLDSHSPFYSYFWLSNFKRHLPELFLIFFSLFYIHRIKKINFNYKNEYFIQLVFSIVILELLNKGSYLYVVWFFLPFYLYLYQYSKKILILFFIFYLISYIASFFYNHSYNHYQLSKKLRELTDSKTVILGPHAAVMGVYDPKNFIYLDGKVPGLIDYNFSKNKILVVTKDNNEKIELIEKYGHFNIGWLIN